MLVDVLGWQWAWIGVAACAPTQLLKATADYATVSVAATSELHDAPGILTQLCRDRLELEYMTDRLVPGQVTGSLQDFVDQPFRSASGNVSITWKQRCAGLHRAEDAFERGLLSIQRYGAALGGFAGKDLTPDTDIRNLAAAAADDAANLTDDAQPYHAAIAGLGAPLAELARTIEGDWKGHALEPLIAKTDEPLHRAIAQLDEFIRVVRQRHLVDARVALHDLVIAVGQKDLVTTLLASRLDIEITDHLDQLDAKLKAMSDVLNNLAAAHTKLAEGWQRGEDHGLATLTEIATFAHDVYSDIKAFQHPSAGGGT